MRNIKLRKVTSGLSGGNMITKEFTGDFKSFSNVVFLKLVSTFIILIMGIHSYYALSGIHK